MNAIELFASKCSVPIKNFFEKEKIIMKNIAKVLALILAMIMVLGLVACSCAGDPEIPNDDDDTTTANTTTGSNDGTTTPSNGDAATTPSNGGNDTEPNGGNATTTAPVTTYPGGGAPLPDKTFEDGQNEFVFAVRGTAETAATDKWTIADIVAEGHNDEALETAIGRRNDYMKSEYNVDISVIFAGDCGVGNRDSAEGSMYNTVTTNVIAGGEQMDALISNPYTAVGFAMEGIVINLNDLTYVEFDKDWWDTNVFEGLKFGSANYMIAGDATTVDNKAVHVFLFNKEIFGSMYNGDDLYSIVENQQWTLDKFISYAENASDNGGDGSWDLNDKYGFTYWQDTMSTFITSWGGYFGSYKGGKPVMAIRDTQFTTRWTKGVETISNTWVLSRVDYWLEADMKEGYNDIFYDGNILFAWSDMGDTVLLGKNANIEFGIVPVPKFNDKQTDYITTPHVYGFAMMTILYPDNLGMDSMEDTGLILEAFTRKSNEVVTPAFYEIVLRGKAANNEDDAKMLDIVYSKIAYDVGNFLNPDDCMSGMMVEVYRKKNTNVLTWYDSAESTIQDELDYIVNNLFY